MSFIKRAYANLSDAEKKKIGSVGTRINTDGDHKVKIVTAYEGDYEGQPNFNVTFEDAQGKTVEWTGYLTSEVTEKDGVVQAGMYSVNGVQTQLNNKGDRYDNLKTMGIVKNLCKIVGTTLEEAAGAITEGNVTAFGKTITAPVWNSLIGKELTIVTSYEITADKKDPKKVYRNQKVSMSNLFTAAGLSQIEVDAGKTEPSAINSIIALAKKPAEQYADIGYGIKFSDKSKAACISELKVIGSAGQAPAVESAPAGGTTAVADNEPEF